MAYKSESKLNDVKRKIEDLAFDVFKDRISVVALDSTYFIRCNLTKNESDIVCTSLCEDKYFLLLREEAMAKKEYAKFSESYTKDFRNLPSRQETKHSICFKTYSEKNVRTDDNFNPDAWHKVLIEEGYGGCSIILSKTFDGVQSIIYLILDKDLPEITADHTINWLKLNMDICISESIKRFIDKIFLYLEELMIEEMIHYMYKDSITLRDDYKLETLEKKAAQDNRRVLRSKVNSFGHIINGAMMGTSNEFVKINDYKNTDSIQKIRENLDNLEKHNKFIALVVRLLSKDENSNSVVKPLDEFTDLRHLVEYIQSNFVLSNNRVLHYSYLYEADYDICSGNERVQEKLFVIIWNLISNADKHSSTTNHNLWFVVENENFLPCLKIKNYSSLEHSNVLVKCVKGELPLEPEKGMWAVMKNLASINWKIELKLQKIPKIIELWISPQSLKV